MKTSSKLLVFLLPLAVLLSGCGMTTGVKKGKAISANVTEKVESKYTGPRRRIGVMDFVNKTAYGQRRLGQAATDILITELSKTGKFVIVERDKMNLLMQEQKLQMSGAIDSRTAVKVGKILGLNAIVTGAISNFGVKTEGSEFIIVQTKRQVAQCTVDIRVVDVETGEVLLADSGEGYVKSAKGSFLGLGTRGGYDETIEGKALRKAIATFTGNIVSQVNRKPWSCRIAQAAAGKIYLNAGTNMGVEKGLELKCYHLGRKIMDPTTGKVLGYEEVSLGELKVMGPMGDSGEGSWGRFTRKSGVRAKAGDICRMDEE